MCQNNFTLVTIVSNEVSKIIEDLKIKPILNEENVLKFKNNLDCNSLIKKLNCYNIEKLLIEEATLEDIFMHYYE